MTTVATPPVTAPAPAPAPAPARSRHVVRGMALATAATAIWSGNFVIADGMAGSIPPVQLAFWRWVIALVAVLPFGARSLWRERAAVRGGLGFIAVAALLGVTLFNTLIYVAGQSSPATNLALIAAAAPVVIGIGARLMWRERMGAARWTGTALALVGIVVLLGKGSPAALFGAGFASGDLWMVAAMGTFAAYSLLLRRKPEGISGLSLLLSTFALGTLFLAPVYGADVAVHGGFTADAGTVGALLYVGVASSAMAYFAWNKAIALVGAARAGVVYYLQPVMVAALSFFALGNPVSAVQIVSMALVIAGVALGARSARAARG
ncbi:DMT family transporter [Streptomyces sp. ODS28]|uniref:DMT family transporter n=1 Tax=Streptomyces sp. ODS28 TaxID=3136688 RepID=UPI0031F07419